MKPQLFITSCLLFAVLLCQVSVIKGQGASAFNKFVKDALAGYPKWAKDNGLEPSPAIQVPVNLTVDNQWISVTGEITNQILTRHSELEAVNVYSNLENRDFFFEITNNGIASSGSYNVEGVLYASVPVAVSGSSLFFLTNTGAHYTGTVYISNYAITSDGYVDLSGTEARQNIKLLDVSPLFYELVAGGLEQDVTMWLRRRYQDDSQQNLWMPVGEYLKQYLGEVFAKTPYADIIGQ